MRWHIFLLVILTACGHPEASSSPDAALPDPDLPDAATVSARGLGKVTDEGQIACPRDAPPGASCDHVVVTACPELETETLGATIAVLPPTASRAGTIVHLKGDGGEGFLTPSADAYAAAGFEQVFVSWDADWEQAATQGIKAAACRPATILKWTFDTIHGASRSLGFCGEGKSGGSGQLGYALSHYGLGDYLDYVNEWAGPPFARIDLGCDGDAPPTATVCGVPVTMQLPSKLTNWENMTSSSCGDGNVPAAELARWKSDSIAVGGTYSFPNTHVEFFACTSAAPAVTGMAQLYHDVIAAASTDDPSRVAFHCYGEADNCHGEGLGTGDPVREQAMIVGCKPHHDQ